MGKCTMSRSQNARNATLLLNKTSQPLNRNHNLHEITSCARSQLARNHNLNKITTCMKSQLARNSSKSCHTFLLWPLGPLRPQILKKLVTHFHSDHLGHSGHKFSKKTCHTFTLATKATRATVATFSKICGQSGPSGQNESVTIFWEFVARVAQVVRVKMCDKTSENLWP